jgi:hypothetical protein
LTPRHRTDDNSGMDDKATKRGGGAAVALVLVVVLVLLPMLYVLSVGPVARLADNGLIDQNWNTVLGVIYWPLDWTADNVPVVGPAIIWYVESWQPPQPIYSAPTLPSTATIPPQTLPATATAPASAPSAVPAPGGS